MTFLYNLLIKAEMESVLTFEAPQGVNFKRDAVRECLILLALLASFRHLSWCLAFALRVKAAGLAEADTAGEAWNRQFQDWHQLWLARYFSLHREHPLHIVLGV